MSLCKPRKSLKKHQRNYLHYRKRILKRLWGNFPSPSFYLNICGYYCYRESLRKTVNISNGISYIYKLSKFHGGASPRNLSHRRLVPLELGALLVPQVFQGLLRTWFCSLRSWRSCEKAKKVENSREKTGDMQLIIFLASLSHSSNARVQRGARVFEFFVLTTRPPAPQATSFLAVVYRHNKPHAVIGSITAHVLLLKSCNSVIFS